MAKAKKGKAAAGGAARPTEMLLVSSKVRQMIKDAGCNTAGDAIDGLGGLVDWRDGVVFHAGTTRMGDRVVTDGGRVLGVTALGDDIAAAVRGAYAAIERIRFDGMQYRRDIGHRALARGAEDRHGRT